MALIQRFSKLVNADLHSVLDLMEEPYSLLKQAVREMESSLELQQQEVADKRQALKEENKYLENLEKQRQKQQQELTLCLESDNHELARGLIKRKLITEKRIAQHQGNQESLSHLIDELDTTLNNNYSKLESMQQELRLLDEQRSTQNISQYDSVFDISDEEIEIALLAEKHARSQS